MVFWLAALSTVVGGVLQSRSARRTQETQGQQTAEQQREAGRQDRETLRYQGELADYWSQRNTQRRRDARGAMYDKYSTIAKPAGFARNDLYSGDAPVANAVPVTNAAPSGSTRSKSMPPGEGSLWDGGYGPESIATPRKK